jgi:N-acetylglucosamine kinase-like BadF-type ATPase
MEEQTLAGISEDLMEVFEVDDEPRILAKLYRSGEVAAKLAKLAKSFTKAVQAAEPSALDFLREETIRLAQQIVTHAERFMGEKGEISVCLAGGLWKISPIFEKELGGRLKEISGGRTIELTRIKRAPVEGAVALAMELLQ